MTSKLNPEQKARVLSIAYLDSQLKAAKIGTTRNKFNKAIYRKFIYFSIYLSDKGLTEEAEQYAKDCDILMSITAEEIGD